MVVIIGGGIIGLSAAFYLAQAGIQVTIIDREGFKSGCSYGNAGMITPSHFVPMAAPGVVWQGIKWMFDAKSPFYIHPRWSMDLFRWGYYFMRHANQKHVDRSAGTLLDLFSWSMELYQEWEKILKFPLHRDGIIMISRTEKHLHHEFVLAEHARKMGLKVTNYREDELCGLFPDIRINAKGGVHYHDDATTDPGKVMDALLTYLRSHHLVNLYRDEVKAFLKQGSTITGVKGKSVDYPADAFVLTAGVWSRQLLKDLNYHLPLQAGKGYSLTFAKDATLPPIPFILTEDRLVGTPMGEDYRLAGTMEISRPSLRMNKARVEVMQQNLLRYFPEFKWGDYTDINQWVGLRPCSADGLPYLGQIKGHHNIYISTGHAMVGLGLAPVSGKIIVALIQNQSVRFDLSPCDPNRFL